MKVQNIDNMTSFSKFFRMVLSKLYAAESEEIYAYYEKKACLFIGQPKIAATHPISFKLYSRSYLYPHILIITQCL